MEFKWKTFNDLTQAVSLSDLPDTVYVLRTFAEVSTVDDMVRHIIHLYNVGGSDIVALGSDYDGIDCDVEMKDFTEIYKLYDKLRKHFSEDTIDKFFYKNGERILETIHNSQSSIHS